MMGPEEFNQLGKQALIGAIMFILTVALIAFCVGFFFAGHGQAAEPIVFDLPVANFTLGQDPAPQQLCIPVPEPPICEFPLPSKRSFLASSGGSRPYGPTRPGRPGCHTPEANSGLLLIIAALCLLFVVRRK